MTDQFRELCAEFSAIEDALSGNMVLASNQGQSLDGYSALANFRSVAKRARAYLAAKPQGEGDDGLPPRVGHILRLAEIIREVDGSHNLGASALAEAILSHPGARWGRPTPQPIPVSELPGPKDCDAEGRCWWYGEGEDMVGWTYQDSQGLSYYRATHWLPYWALPDVE